MKNFIKYISGFLGILFLSFLFLEIILNISGILYRDIRKKEFMDSNKNTDQTVTIIAMGDSHTYGGNVKYDQTYSYLLWEKLRAYQKNKKINLINAGVCEYNSSQVLYELDKNIAKHNPNYAIILVGSSDFWNLINPNEKSSFTIKNPSYDAEQTEIKQRIYGKENNIWQKTKSYKFFRLMILNIYFKKAVDKMEKEFIKIDDSSLMPITSQIFMEMFKKNQHSKVIEYSLKLLKALPPDSIYYDKSLSIFYAISIAYQFQSKYSAIEIAKELESILSQRPEIQNKEFILKYINYFKERDKFELEAQKRLESNLNEINKRLRSKKITPIFLTYPSEYKIANRIIKKTAKNTDSYIIDLESVFKNLLLSENKGKYFDDDEHINAKGHRIIADEIFNFLKSKI
ncbi:MAG TPA: SGNH/GDSL hydrolase family protein [Elusimicrobiales bacterium]|nr:SGNH/GDSL hydrolase family protein [Elusimicrobiales bacterium]HPO95400.1 SGNH/GDSL hydrolase family protein [Elusimicrobiales bacterium]